ncbi:MAG TPA: hypothetical protein VFP68_01550 [Burkholderiaceae bacterium]|nr:hypothetical protein [Burkholderiaceae bacterium]
MVACIAMVAGVDYTVARERAAAVANFDGSEGVFLDKAKNVLGDLGVRATYHGYRVMPTAWSDLPNTAIVQVDGPDGTPHGVVFRRKGGREFILDWNKQDRVPREAANYKLHRYSPYLEIHK